MDRAGIAIVALNLVLGFGVGWPMARRLSETAGAPGGRLRTYVLLILVYFVESVAFSASMATDILSLVLAAVWGVLVGRRLRRHHATWGQVRKDVSLFSFYTGLPAASFLSVPVLMARAGWPVLTAEGGLQFGIPDFAPWPVNTILGFCVAVALFAVVGKVAISTGIVRHMTMSKGA